MLEKRLRRKRFDRVIIDPSSVRHDEIELVRVRDVNLECVSTCKRNRKSVVGISLAHLSQLPRNTTADCAIFALLGFFLLRAASSGGLAYLAGHDGKPAMRAQSTAIPAP